MSQLELSQVDTHRMQVSLNIAGVRPVLACFAVRDNWGWVLLRKVQQDKRWATDVHARFDGPERDSRLLAVEGLRALAEHITDVHDWAT
jgi:hypothetical protein